MDGHAFLGAKRNFSNWLKDRIAKYDFAQDLDFIEVGFNSETGVKSKGRPFVDYMITLDMAKELAMVENNAKGREVRRYFIECERRAPAIPTPVSIEKILSDPDTFIRLATSYRDEKAKCLELEAKIEADRPKNIFADAVSTSHDSILVGELAKLICQNGHPIGQRRLFEWMRENEYLMIHGSSWNLPTQKSMDMETTQKKCCSRDMGLSLKNKYA